jgi:hypothetical protein
MGLGKISEYSWYLLVWLFRRRKVVRRRVMCLENNEELRGMI